MWASQLAQLYIGMVGLALCKTANCRLQIACIFFYLAQSQLRHNSISLTASQKKSSKENKNDKTLDLWSFQFWLNLIRIQVRLKCSFESAITHYDVIVVVVIPELFTNVVCTIAMSPCTKDSGVVTTNRSCPVYVNKRQGTRCMLGTW